MTSSEWAAWVQAIGSIAAILAAIAIAAYQQNKSARSRHSEKQSLATDLAILIFEEVYEWHLSCLQWQGSIEAVGVASHRLVVIDTAKFIVHTGVPGGVKNLFGRLHELEDAAQPVQMAVVYTNTLKHNLEILVAFDAGRIPEQELSDGDPFGIVEKHLKLIFQAVDASKASLLGYYGGRKWRPRNSMAR